MMPSSPPLATLVPWLQTQRWFPGKGQTFTGAEIVDQAVVDGVLVMLLRLDGAAGGLWLVPVRADAAAWHDAFALPVWQRRLFELVAHSGTLALAHGRIVGHAAAALPASAPDARLVTAEQSNTSLIYGDIAILKCYRRVVAGINPDIEIGQALASGPAAALVPALLGSLAYHDAAGVVHSLGMLQAFEANHGDAWQRLQHLLADLFVATAAIEPHDEATAEAMLARLSEDVWHELARLGQLVGALHRALAAVPGPAFAPQRFGREAAAEWIAGVWQAWHETGALLARYPAAAAQAGLTPAGWAGFEPALARCLARVTGLADAGVALSRVHGDLHLGQILMSSRGPLVLDFEGEPLRPLHERRAHASPLKDVAGMTRSLGYAATAAAFASVPPHDAALRWAERWRRQARARFLAAYDAAAGALPGLPADAALRAAALAAFELERAIYEVRYEIANRPDWLQIPLHGIRSALHAAQGGSV
jgi:trehalose synthase-fused probable maltokinase